MNLEMRFYHEIVATRSYDLLSKLIKNHDSEIEADARAIPKEIAG